MSIPHFRSFSPALGRKGNEKKRPSAALHTAVFVGHCSRYDNATTAIGYVEISSESPFVIGPLCRKVDINRASGAPLSRDSHYVCAIEIASLRS